MLGSLKNTFSLIEKGMVAYPIQLHCLTHQKKCQKPSLSFKGVSSGLKYTKEILKNTNEKLHKVSVFSHKTIF